MPIRKVADVGVLTSVEICAGAGGQALGLEQAGFRHVALVENDAQACLTLRNNRPEWNVLEEDVRQFVDRRAPLYEGVDLVAGGVPCPPFSVAGKQLGSDDDRDLFPTALGLIEVCKPRAVMLENVRGLLDRRFGAYRQQILDRLAVLGYCGEWKLLNASDYAVPQLRPRAVLVALKAPLWEHFIWPSTVDATIKTVGDVLFDAMASRGWRGAMEWRKTASKIAPTLVGGSHKHGGPDLGPTRAKKAWADIGVNAHVLADEVPGCDFVGTPSLTVPMAALLQGFPADWQITGRKTAAYRQVGNAFPPPVAKAVGTQIAKVLSSASQSVLERDSDFERAI